MKPLEMILQPIMAWVAPVYHLVELDRFDSSLGHLLHVTPPSFLFHVSLQLFLSNKGKKGGWILVAPQLKVKTMTVTHDCSSFWSIVDT